MTKKAGEMPAFFNGLVTKIRREPLTFAILLTG
jgi:hypothetical protein